MPCSPVKIHRHFGGPSCGDPASRPLLADLLFDLSLILKMEVAPVLRNVDGFLPDDTALRDKGSTLHSYCYEKLKCSVYRLILSTANNEVKYSEFGGKISARYGNATAFRTAITCTVPVDPPSLNSSN
jgi:hypothetical protein